MVIKNIRAKIIGDSRGWHGKGNRHHYKFCFGVLAASLDLRKNLWTVVDFGQFLFSAQQLTSGQIIPTDQNGQQNVIFASFQGQVGHCLYS
jgi:hypothetical protein